MTAAFGPNPYLLEILQEKLGPAEAVAYLERMNDGYAVFVSLGFANGLRGARGDARLRHPSGRIAVVVARVVVPKQEGDRGWWPRLVRTIWAGDVRAALVSNGGSFGVEGIPRPQWGRLLRSALEGPVDVPFARTSSEFPTVGFWDLS